MPNVRVAHLFSADLAMWGQFAYVQTLLARGWDVTMFAPEGPHTAQCLEMGCHWKPLHFERRVELGDDVRHSVSLFRELREGKFDIVHTHNVKVGLIGRVLGNAARAPIVVHTHHGMLWNMETPLPKRLVHAALERIASLRTDAVFVQSRVDRASILRMRCIDPERTVLIGNGVNLEKFDPARFDDATRAALRAVHGFGPDDVVFVSAGRLVREKGFLELFEAFRAAREENPKIRLAIAGPRDIESPDHLSKELLDEAERGGVVFLGNVSDMPAFYAASDVMCMFSWREGMCRSLMEAAAMGKPSIASRIGGNPEIVDDGVTGVLLPVRDADAIRRTLLDFASNTEKRRRYGQNALARARLTFDIRRTIGIINATYDRLLARRHLRVDAARPSME